MRCWQRLKGNRGLQKTFQVLYSKKTFLFTPGRIVLSISKTMNFILLAQRICILLLCFALIGCQRDAGNKANHSGNRQVQSSLMKFHELRKLSVIGDFDGDGAVDSVFQGIRSGVTRLEIENSPDPFQNEWDSVAQWFYDQNADVYLVMNRNIQDTLRLGVAQGLYCLINVGDLNADGTDEVAFAVDVCDFSNVNSCSIYSICNGRWSKLKSFGINEIAFAYTDEMPRFTSVKGYLENHKGVWMYSDANNDEPDAQTMKRLIVDNCK